VSSFLDGYRRTRVSVISPVEIVVSHPRYALWLVLKGGTLACVWPNEEGVVDRLTHFDEHGASRMVDVSEKPVTVRIARACGLVRMSAQTLERVREGDFRKGNVIEVARLAGIMAAKRTGDLIPLCHPLPLDAVEIQFRFLPPECLEIEATVRCTGRTGVEMEALTAVSVAGLTVYDMCKAVDRGMQLERIQLEEKSGGRSGHFLREE
jgi:cyclic pyranopterin phosphate synthase